MGCFKADEPKTEFKLPGYLEGAQKDIAARAQHALNTPFKAYTAPRVAGMTGIAAARRSGRLLDVGTMLPLGTSAVTIGFGMFITFDHAPVDWRGDRWLIAVGHALVAVPFVVRATLPVLELNVPLVVEAKAAKSWAEAH